MEEIKSINQDSLGKDDSNIRILDKNSQVIIFMVRSDIDLGEFYIPEREKESIERLEMEAYNKIKELDLMEKQEIEIVKEDKDIINKRYNNKKVMLISEYPFISSVIPNEYATFFIRNIKTIKTNDVYDTNDGLDQYGFYKDKTKSWTIKNDYKKYLIMNHLKKTKQDPTLNYVDIPSILSFDLTLRKKLALGIEYISYVDLTPANLSKGRVIYNIIPCSKNVLQEFKN
jgi:hypothetical protein